MMDAAKTGKNLRPIKKMLPLIAGVLASVVLGFSFLTTKTGLNINGHDANRFLAFRFLIAFLVMALMVRLGLFKVNYRDKDIRLLLLCGLLNPVISQYLELTAVKYAPTSQLGLFFSLGPVFVIVLSARINKETPSKKQIIYLLMSVAGVLAIQFANSQQEGGNSTGFLLATLASLTIATQRVLVRRASGSFSAFEIIFVLAGIGAVYFPVVSVTQHLIRGDISNFFSDFANPTFVFSILYSSVICYVGGFLLMTYAAANLPIAVSSATNTVLTAVAVFAGVFFLDEGFRVVDAVGTILILGSVILMSFSYNPSVSNKFGSQKSATNQSGVEVKNNL